MSNLLRTLIFNDEVSLTIADTTEIVREGMRLHKLSPASAYLYGRGMSALTYMSSCLKESTGEISLSLKCEGEAADMGISGNRALNLRGYVANTQIEGGANYESELRALGNDGSITIIRDDGYSRPFVGSCGFPQQLSMDDIFEEYYRSSEQIPTYIATVVEINEEGVCLFAGVLALQPLPFASEETLDKVWSLDLYEILETLKGKTVEEVVRENFQTTSKVWELREARYKCNCSREYLKGVLVTLGEEQLRDIIAQEGAVRVHCHYCNSDYEFTEEDANELFKK
ncbi:MAG: Hsp33 family molecular chaperone HslO [Clostridia bacterium]|nr:Hsp33 family molecular chaperone HslO [Clostridia bacterium]